MITRKRLTKCAGEPQFRCRSPGRGHNLQEEAGARVKQGQNLGNGEAASGGLGSRLAEVGLQLRSVGHGK